MTAAQVAAWGDGNFPSHTHMLPGGLKRALFGGPLSKRENAGDEETASLDLLITELLGVLKAEHGPNVAYSQVEREFTLIRSFPSTSTPSGDLSVCEAGVACKRAMLLTALWQEPEFAERFRESDGDLIDDLTNRVLPLVGPVFAANIGQRPDSFVAVCAVMHEMYTGDDIAAGVREFE